jgi:uncharacterized protein (DUF488 family)
MTPRDVGARVFTVGHSTRTAADLLAVLRAHGVTQVADIRTVPRSRRSPHFSRDRLERWLPASGVTYRHFPALGGLRRPRPDSVNTAWRHAGFRGYADYMATPEFRRGADDLLEFAACGPTAVMCAEAVWWRCHRSLLADALVHRGVEVLHLTAPAVAPKPHQLCEFARVADGKLMYPGLA